MWAEKASWGAEAMAMLATGALLGEPAPVGTIVGRVQRTAPTAALSDFVIWVEDIDAQFPAPGQAAVMNQEDLRFVPHVLAIQAGTTVEFPNRDPVSHNVFSISEAKRFNLGLYGRDMIRRVTFDKPGVVELLCNVHLEMGAYIVVIKNPYFTQANSDGTYRIASVPAGPHRLRCWHERLPVTERAVEVPPNGSVTLDFVTRSETTPSQSDGTRPAWRLSGRQK